MKKLRYFESKHNSYSEKTSEQTDEADRRDEAEVKRYPNRVKYYDKQLLSASKKDPLTKSLCGRIVWVLQLTGTIDHQQIGFTNLSLVPTNRLYSDVSAVNRRQKISSNVIVL